jgi:uncharacterized phage infection (PIP) family protein YhgE
MGNTRYRGSSNIGGQGSPSTSPQAGASAIQQVSELAGDLKKQASEVAQHATDQLKDQASELAEGAKGLVSEAGEKLRSAAEDQKNAGADFVSEIASAIRRAAGEFDQQLPQAGQYIRRAAEQVDSASDALRRRDLTELVGGIHDFARRQPTAFLGATVLAGFAVVRFLKSATASQTGSGDSSWQSGRRSFLPSSMPANQGMNPSPRAAGTSQSGTGMSQRTTGISQERRM